MEKTAIHKISEFRNAHKMYTNLNYATFLKGGIGTICCSNIFPFLKGRKWCYKDFPTLWIVVKKNHFITLECDMIDLLTFVILKHKNIKLFRRLNPHLSWEYTQINFIRF